MAVAVLGLDAVVDPVVVVAGELAFGIGDRTQVVLRVILEGGGFRFRRAEAGGLGDAVAADIIGEARAPALGVGGLDVAVAGVVGEALDTAAGIDQGDAVADPVVFEAGLEVERVDDPDVAVQRVVDVLRRIAAAVGDLQAIAHRVVLVGLRVAFGIGLLDEAVLQVIDVLRRARIRRAGLNDMRVRMPSAIAGQSEAAGIDDHAPVG